jgi:hypothetical protein
MSNTSNATSYSNWNSDDICFFKTKSHHGSYLELKHLLTEAAYEAHAQKMLLGIYPITCLENKVHLTSLKRIPHCFLFFLGQFHF